MGSSAKLHCKDKLKTWTFFWDFRLLPRCIWGLRSSGMFYGLVWWSVVDISGQYLSHLQRSNNRRQIAWLMEDLTSMWSRNVGNWLPTYATQIPLEWRAILILTPEGWPPHWCWLREQRDKCHTKKPVILPPQRLSRHHPTTKPPTTCADIPHPDNIKTSRQ